MLLPAIWIHVAAASKARNRKKCFVSTRPCRVLIVGHARGEIKPLSRFKRLLETIPRGAVCYGFRPERAEVALSPRRRGKPWQARSRPRRTRLLNPAQKRRFHLAASSR